MGFKVGVPLLKLTNKRSSKSSGKRTGILRSVACEALEERAGKDPDIDRSRTQDNVYEGIRSGRRLAEVMTAEAEEYSKARQAAGGRALRSTAAIAFVAITKPESSAIMAMSEAERDRFFEDSQEVLDGILGADNVRSRVRHKDELGEHIHTFRMGFTPDGKLATDYYFSPKMMSKINKEYPAAMRARGWDVEDCDCYDADKAAADPDYVKQRRAKRKKNGRESSVVKMEKDAARAAALDQRENQLEGVEQLQGQRSLLQVQRSQDLKRREAQLKRDKAKLKEGQEQLKADRRALEAEKRAFVGEKVKVQQLAADALKLNDRASHDEESVVKWAKGKGWKQSVQAITQQHNERQEQARKVSAGARSVADMVIRSSDGQSECGMEL